MFPFQNTFAAAEEPIPLEWKCNTAPAGSRIGTASDGRSPARRQLLPMEEELGSNGGQSNQTRPKLPQSRLDLN